MDTTKLECEVKQLREQVDALMKNHHTHGGVDPKPTEPKFWIAYKAHDDNSDKPVMWNTDHICGSKAVPVFSFTREMLIAMGVDLIDWDNQMTETKVITFLDNYLTDGGEK